MKEKRVEEIMNTNIIGVAPSTSVADTVREMRKQGVNSILILENRQPVSIFKKEIVFDL